MKKNCPNSNCLHFNTNAQAIKDGFFQRKDDARQIQRYKCKACKTKFSASTSKLCYRQQKRRINHDVFKLLSSGVSMRRAAFLKKVSRGTIARRLKYFGNKYRARNKKDLSKISKRVSHFQLDDLITKENSKLLPLSVTIAVNVDNRKILGAKVSQIPAFGHLTQKSLKKYGKRKCCHVQGIKELFYEIQDSIHPEAVIISDKHKKYPDQIKDYFPKAKHKVYESERAHVAGQGELKKVNFDPLFTINHTCAMFRANINRLIRKTWCTTKDPARLQDHIDTFIYFYNHYLLKDVVKDISKGGDFCHLIPTG